MKNTITVIQNIMMYLTLLILGVSIVSFALKTIVWFLYIMLTEPMHALGYTCLGVIMVIGVSTAIDKIKE
jgi:hypothetical protein